jgi:hypothetical protein
MAETRDGGFVIAGSTMKEWNHTGGYFPFSE